MFDHLPGREESSTGERVRIVCVVDVRFGVAVVLAVLGGGVVTPKHEPTARLSKQAQRKT